ncbi:PAS domain-containing sensor histidine kinase [Phycicoccus sonneratiae]|uniref:histidine kinase n=1 Tax=Phycicoccus sonneratiae TaxID=2807628 RepID=A0ABS2CTY0_9MICO|nr:PAS domain S-box protein [Phycicoccus sonneraticus]MBM6402534.1 PAS domain S-box protein [Phycicoccus sonneraticus]
MAEHDADRTGRGAAAAQALERMSGGVFSLSRDGTVLYVNEAILALARMEWDDLVGRSVHDLAAQSRDLDFLHVLDRALASGEVEEFESFAPRVGRWLRRRLYPTDDGVTVLVDEGRPSAGPDVPDSLRDALERAEAAEVRYRDLLDSMAEGWKETSPSGDLLVVNDSLAHLLGYDDAADLLAHVSSANDLYVDPEDRLRGLASETGGRPRMIEAQMRRRDGGTVWVRAVLTPRLSVTGEIQSYRGFVEDVTERRDAERRRREAEEHIESRERSLLAEVVHDEPLQLVVAAMLRLEVLEPRLAPDLSEPVDQVVSLLEQSVERLRNLVAALSPPDLSDGLAPGLRTLADGIFMGTPTTVEVVDALGVPLAAETQARAYRILREALVNARRHARAAQVVVDLEERDGDVVLSVADDGVGGAVPNPDPGHLGMTSMATRAEDLGGRLRIESPPGGGTTVSLVLSRA